MVTQDSIRDYVFLIIDDIQMSKKTRLSVLNDPQRAYILDLRERLIEIANELKSIYWLREANEKNGLVPHTDHGLDEKLVKEAQEIFKQMCALNTDIGKEVQYGI